MVQIGSRKERIFPFLRAVLLDVELEDAVEEVMV